LSSVPNEVFHWNTGSPSDLQFQILHDIAGALKLLADLSTANNNIGASAVFDAENIKKELDGLIVKLNSRNK
jgi:hypothetical protein